RDGTKARVSTRDPVHLPVHWSVVANGSGELLCLGRHDARRWWRDGHDWSCQDRNGGRGGGGCIGHGNRRDRHHRGTWYDGRRGIEPRARDRAHGGVAAVDSVYLPCQVCVACVSHG